ncbi:MAG TPA: PAS domain S-box protein [Pyrinomonadaceae bacterium]
MTQVKRSTLARYSLPVLLVAVAAAVTWLIPMIGQRVPFALFYIPVIIAALYGGRGPALVAIGLTLLAAAYLFLQPIYTFEIGQDGLVRLITFALIALMVSLVIERIKVAETRAQESRDQLFTTLRSIGDAVIATDARGHVTFLNEVAQGLTGWSLEEAKGKALREVFHIVNEMTRAEIESPVEEVLRDGNIVGLANHTILIARDGKEIPIDDSGAPIRNRDGEVTGIVLVFRDITDRRQAEAVSQRLASIVESSQDAIFSKTLDGTITSWNASAARLYGYLAEEIIGRNVSILAPPGHTNEVANILDRLKRGEHFEHFETRRVTKDGKVLDIALTVSPIKDSAGAIIGASTIARDITERKRVETALRESEERLMLALHSARMGTWEWNIQTDELTWSDTLEPLHGLQPGTFAGTFEDFNKLIHPDDREHLNETIRRAIAERSTYDLEFRVVWPDGSVHWMGGKGRVSLDEAGNPLRMTGLGMDITERKRAEEAIRAGEDRYRAFVENSSEGIWRLELSEPVSIYLPADEQIENFYTRGYLAECNDAMAAMYGFKSAAEIVGAKLEDLLVCDDPNNVEYLRAFVRSGYRLTEAESHEVDREGNSKYFLNNLVGIIEDGKLLRGWGTQRDITERKYAEELLRRSAKQLALITDTAPVFIAQCDAETRFKFVNKAYAARFGLKPEDCVGKKISEITGAEAYDALSEYVGVVLSGKPIEFDIDIPYATIGSHFMHCSYTPEFDESGKVIGWVAAISDLSERRRAEQERELMLERERVLRAAAEEANRTKDEFLATLSHELRTPLTAMLGWTRMLRLKELDETTAERALETVERNAKAQAQLIEDLLDVSRIITGKLRLEVRPLELLPVIEAAMDSVQPAANAKLIKLEASLDPRAGPVSGDAARLQQVVWNLISNAVKFTPKGGHVSLRLERTPSHVEINVSDTGQGIGKDFLPFVFDRFRQADGSTTRMHGGLGLGLAIVRHLVELHGGTVEAESPGPGQGATFKVRLPVIEKQNPESGSQEPE